MTFYPNERYLRNKLYDGYEFEKGYSYDDVVDISIPEEGEVFPFSTVVVNVEYTEAADSTSSEEVVTDTTADLSGFIT
jgi:hypothetical protein